MRKLLVVLLTFLSFCVVADESVILGSFERQTEEFEMEYFGFSFETSWNGFGVQFLNFVDSGYYFAGKFSHLSADTDICVGSQCVSPDTDTIQTVFSGEIGWNYRNLTPFFGLSFFNEESEGETVDYSGFITGAWLDFDTFKLRGAITSIDQTEFTNARIWFSGGLLYQMDNNWAFGAEIGMETDGDGNGFRFSLSLGRSL
ncbi:MAG: hypothetical protein F4W92_09075 [Gammaproteobacteria bacterium]|nr:hypothetical protein [Gammaproteobacteria bacterium]